MTNEAFARVKIDQLLKNTDWSLTDSVSGRADYVSFDGQGRALAVLKAKGASLGLSAGETQERRYTNRLDLSFIFLSNGEEVWFREKSQDAHFRRGQTGFAQDDPVRRKPARGLCSDLLRFVPVLTVFVAIACCSKGVL